MFQYLSALTPASYRLPLEYYYRYFTRTLESELYFLRKLLKNHSKRRAIDIGANRGLYTYALSQIFEQVESFEPQPSCNQVIRDYSKNNPKVTIHTSALSNASGNIRLHIPIIRGRVNTTLATGCASITPPSCEHTVLEVPMKTLDEYNFKDVNFIKIDVEGHEMEVIEGGRENISKWHPILLIEIEQRHLVDVPIGNTFNKIIGLGYDGFFLQNNRLVEISLFDTKVHQNLSSHKREYINNFIFKPKEK
jgi:FkbM family methyltransferase